MNHLPDLDVIKQYCLYKKLRIAHLTATYDGEIDKLIYDRKLVNGSGSSLYGLEVCRSLALDKEFISKANSIRRNLEDKPKTLYNTRKSKYNSKIYVDKCALCGTSINLHTHHIKEQDSADKDGFIGNYHKNVQFNLLIICQECHKQIHLNGSQVAQKQTLNGVYLSIS